MGNIHVVGSLIITSDDSGIDQAESTLCQDEIPIILIFGTKDGAGDVDKMPADCHSFQGIPQQTALQMLIAGNISHIEHGHFPGSPRPCTGTTSRNVSRHQVSTDLFACVSVFRPSQILFCKGKPLYAGCLESGFQISKDRGSDVRCTDL